MRIQEVKTTQDWQAFHAVPHRIYAGDPNWICPLEGDVQGIFDPAQNEAWQHGIATAFVLWDDEGKPAGRVAAFVDHHSNERQPHPIGGMGFFECIDDSRYAAALFAQAEDWLQHQGMKIVEGPINFGGRDKYWGLLVKGFAPPLFQENYQPTYYQRFFSEQGYIPYEQILTMKGLTSGIHMGRLKAIADRIRANHEVRLELYNPRYLDRYADDFCEIYNAAFSQYAHFRPAKPENIKHIMHEARFLADPLLLCICYFEGKPAGFCTFFPEINPLIKKANGRLRWWLLPGLLWKLRFGRGMGIKGIGFAVHPDYRTKGIAAFLVEFMASDALKTKYRDFYLTTVRAHNKDAMGVYTKLGDSVIDRVHLGMRKSLDPAITIEPHEFIEV